MNEFEAAVIGDEVPLEQLQVIIRDCIIVMCYMLQACEKQYLKEVRDNRLTNNTKFAYSWHLIKSQYSTDVRKGITLMHGM